MATIRAVDLVASFDTSAVEKGAKEASKDLQSLDKSVQGVHFDTAKLEQYSKALDKLAKQKVKPQVDTSSIDRATKAITDKKIVIKVDELGLTKVEAQIKRMVAQTQLGAAMEGKGSHWREYEKTRQQWEGKGKGSDFAKTFSAVFAANMARDMSLAASKVANNPAAIAAAAARHTGSYKWSQAQGDSAASWDNSKQRVPDFGKVIDKVTARGGWSRAKIAGMPHQEQLQVLKEKLQQLAAKYGGTVLQSGNVISTAGMSVPKELAAALERIFTEHTGGEALSGTHSVAAVKKLFKGEAGYLDLGKLLKKPTAYNDLTGFSSAEHAAIANATGSFHSDLSRHGGTSGLMAGWQMGSGSGGSGYGAGSPVKAGPFGTGPHPPDFETTDPGSRFTHRNMVAAMRRAKRGVMGFLQDEGGWFDPNNVMAKRIAAPQADKMSVLGSDYANWKAQQIINTAKTYKAATSGQGNWLTRFLKSDSGALAISSGAGGAGGGGAGAGGLGMPLGGMKRIIGAGGGAAEAKGFGLLGGMSKLVMANIPAALIAGTLAFVPKIIDNVKDKITDFSERVAPGFRKSLNDMFDPRATNSLSKMKDDLQEAGDEAERLANKFTADADAYGRWRSKELSLSRATKGTEAHRGAYQDFVTDYRSLREINELHGGSRADFLKRRISAPDMEHMQFQLASMMNPGGKATGAAEIAINKRAEELAGRVAGGSSAAIQQAVSLLGKHNQYGQILGRSLDIGGVTREALTRSRMEGRPGAVIGARERIADLQEEWRIQEKLAKDVTLTVEERQRELSLHNQMISSSRSIGGQNAINMQGWERQDIIAKRKEAQVDEITSQKEQLSIQQSLLAMEAGGNELAQHRAEIERQFQHDRKDGLEATATELRNNRLLAVELDRQRAVKAETTQIDRAHNLLGFSGRMQEIGAKMKSGEYTSSEGQKMMDRELQARRDERKLNAVTSLHGLAQSTWEGTRTLGEKRTMDLAHLALAARTGMLDQNTLWRGARQIATRDQVGTDIAANQRGSAAAYTTWATAQNAQGNFQAQMNQGIQEMVALLRAMAGPARNIQGVANNMRNSGNLPGVGDQILLGAGQL